MTRRTPSLSAGAGAARSGVTAAAAGGDGVAATARLKAAGQGAVGGPDRWRAVVFGVCIVAILAAAAWALLGSSLLVVRHEEVSGNKTVPTAMVLAAADIRRGMPLEDVNAAAVAHRIERIPQVLRATVRRSWPDSVVISITERTPELAVARNGEFALIDGYGVTVQLVRTRPAGLPLLNSPPARLRGNPGIRAAVEVLRQLPATLRHEVESVSAATANSLTFRLLGGSTVVWGGPVQTPVKVAELMVLMRTHARYYDVSDPATAVTQG